MTCHQFHSLLEDFADGELPDEQSARLRDHLETCGACRHEVESTRKLKQVLRNHPRPDPGPMYWDEVTRLIMARTVEATPAGTTVNQEESKRSVFFRSVVSAAASVLILITALYLGDTYRQPPATVVIADQPVVLTGSMTQLLGVDDGPVYSQLDRQRLSHGMALLGPPWTFGRTVGRLDILGLE